MVAGGEAGNECTGTWRRVHCRNGWEVEMVAGGDAGNDFIGTWRRVHCRNGWQVDILPVG